MPSKALTHPTINLTSQSVVDPVLSSDGLNLLISQHVDLAHIKLFMHCTLEAANGRSSVQLKSLSLAQRIWHADSHTAMCIPHIARINHMFDDCGCQGLLLGFYHASCSGVKSIVAARMELT